MTTVETVLTRGVADCIVREDLEKKMQGGRPLRIKLGIDPTGADLTLGHAVGLRKLRQFQDLGHQIVLLFGGFTATIGDPTGKSKARPPITFDDVKKNAETYLEQAAKILDIEKCEIVNNYDWLSELSQAELIKMAAHFSASRMFERDMFQERLKKEEAVYVHEFLYPLYVAYDSVEVRADVEVGGTDQHFNLLCGRPMQKLYGQPEQNILTWPLLVGLDGSEKMSKSLGNYIALNDAPNEKFGKLMSVKDEVMDIYFECLTDIDASEYQAMIANDPRNAKVLLAKTIVAEIDGEDAADTAVTDFEQKFVKKERPDNLERLLIGQSSLTIMELVIETKFLSSNGEARRLIQQGGVKFEEEKIDDPHAMVELTSEPKLLQVGKRRFVEVIAV